MSWWTRFTAPLSLSLDDVSDQVVHRLTRQSFDGPPLLLSRLPTLSDVETILKSANVLGDRPDKS